MSPRLAGMEAHPWWDGTGTAASCSRGGRREQPWPLQPVRRAGSFPLLGKHGHRESHPRGTHSLTRRQASQAAASPAQAPVPCPATGGSDEICLPQNVEASAQSLERLLPPQQHWSRYKAQSHEGGTKVVAGKLLVFLGPEILFGLVSPDNLFQKLANIGKRKPKEMIAVCFPHGGAGRINPFVVFPHAGQADTHWGR